MKKQKYNFQLNKETNGTYSVTLQIDNTQFNSTVITTLLWRLSHIYSSYYSGEMSLSYNEQNYVEQFKYITTNVDDFKAVCKILTDYITKYTELKYTPNIDNRQYFDSKTIFQKDKKYQEIFDKYLLNNVYLVEKDCKVFKHPNIIILDNNKKIYSLDCVSDKLYVSSHKRKIPIVVNRIYN